MSRDEFCPKCGKKTFHYSWCAEKLRCSSCNYFLVKEDFEKLKKEAKRVEKTRSKK